MLTGRCAYVQAANVIFDLEISDNLVSSRTAAWMQLDLGTLAEFIDRHAAVHASRSLHSDLIDDFTCLEVDHHHVVQRRGVLLSTADHQMVVESSKSWINNKLLTFAVLKWSVNHFFDSIISIKSHCMIGPCAISYMYFSSTLAHIDLSTCFYLSCDVTKLIYLYVCM